MAKTNEVKKNDSLLSERCALGLRNISFVFEDMMMLFSAMGLKFLSVQRHKNIEERVGLHLLELTEKIVNMNLRLEKSLAKQMPSLQRKEERDITPCIETGLDIDKMQGKMLNELLEHFNYPCKSLRVAEKKKALKLLVEERASLEKAVAEKYPQHDEIIAITASYDGSWHRRGYANHARSPWGQGAWIGDLSKKIISWDYRVMQCSICDTVSCDNKHPDKVPHHLCAKNHWGTIKSMEADIAVSCAKQMLETAGVVLKQATTDGDCTTHNNLQQDRVQCPAQRLYGSADVVSHKSDGRHFNKCTKNAVFDISKACTKSAKIGNACSKRIVPIVPTHDAPSLPV